MDFLGGRAYAQEDHNALGHMVTKSWASDSQELCWGKRPRWELRLRFLEARDTFEELGNPGVRGTHLRFAPATSLALAALGGKAWEATFERRPCSLLASGAVKSRQRLGAWMLLDPNASITHVKPWCR